MSKKNEDEYYGTWPLLFLFAFIVGAMAFVFNEREKTNQCLRWEASWVEEYSYIHTGLPHRSRITVPAHWEEECVERGPLP